MQKTLASIVAALAISAFSAAALAGEGCDWGTHAVQSQPVVTADGATPPATPVPPESGS